MQSQIAQARCNELLALLGERMSIRGLQLDPLGRCQLVLDHRWHVTLLSGPVPGRLLLTCAVGPAGMAQRLDKDTLLAMLQGGFLGAAARGGHLAVDPQGHPCVQMNISLADANLSDLETCLLDLLASARTWQRRLEEGASQPKPVPSVASGAWLHRRI